MTQLFAQHWSSTLINDFNKRELFFSCCNESNAFLLIITVGGIMSTMLADHLAHCMCYLVFSRFFKHSVLARKHDWFECLLQSGNHRRQVSLQVRSRAHSLLPAPELIPLLILLKVCCCLQVHLGKFVLPSQAFVITTCHIFKSET